MLLNVAPPMYTRNMFHFKQNILKIVISLNLLTTQPDKVQNSIAGQALTASIVCACPFLITEFPN